VDEFDLDPIVVANRSHHVQYAAEVSDVVFVDMRHQNRPTENDTGNDMAPQPGTLSARKTTGLLGDWDLPLLLSRPRRNRPGIALDTPLRALVRSTEIVCGTDCGQRGVRA
jgi:hypothetical protein